MSKQYKVEHIVLKEGGELLNVSSSQSYVLEAEVPLEKFLKGFEQFKDFDFTNINVEKTDSRNLSFVVDKIEFAVRKREYLILETDEDRKRREAKVIRRTKRKEIRRLRAEARGETSGKPKDDEDDDIEVIEEVDADKHGRDMYAIMESYGDDITKYPPKLKVLVEKGMRLKEKLDRLEERFAKRFYRAHKKELRKYYGQTYRDENYGNVFQTILEL